MVYLNLLLAALSGLFSCVSSVAVPAQDNVATEILKRQMNASSVCTTFGVDFQSGGNYFINSNSNESFTLVSKFEGCNDDLASLMLVNKDTTDQYDCGQVPTVPNDTPQLATCQILKNQLVSGTYLIIAIGNNGNGEPFSYQREFTIQVGPQQTITQYPTVTSTTTPIVTTTSTSYINSTSTVPNTLAITEPSATHIETLTPQKTTTTTFETVVHTFNRWTKANTVSTVTVTPTCRVPLRLRSPDPNCSSVPKGVRFPKGLKIQAHAEGHVSSDHVSSDHGKDGKHHPRAEVDIMKPSIKKRAPDERTTIVSASSNGTTTFITAPASTQTDVIAATSTFSITAPSQTIRQGSAVQTVTAPVPVETVVKVVYSRAYVTKTFGWTWMKTVTTIPPALATECQQKGGHLNDKWW